MDDGEMPAEIEFSAATRGKSYRPDARLLLPTDFTPDVRADLFTADAAQSVTASGAADAEGEDHPERREINNTRT